MRPSLLPTCAAALLLGSAFLAGAWFGPDAGVAELAAQDRQPPPPRRDTPQPPRTQPAAPLVYETSGSVSASANGLIAVTGSYGVGTSVLYLIDTERRQLAVYEARGGSEGSRRIYLVGARRIDLDLQLEGYNDESEWQYGDLQRMFQQRGGVAPDPRNPTESSRIDEGKR